MFAVKYVGSFEVTECERSSHERRFEFVRSQLNRIKNCSNERGFMEICKSVSLVISPASIKMCSMDQQVVHMSHELRRVSYSTCDPEHFLFAFVAREPTNAATISSPVENSAIDQTWSNPLNRVRKHLDFSAVEFDGFTTNDPQVLETYCNSSGSSQTEHCRNRIGGVLSRDQYSNRQRLPDLANEALFSENEYAEDSQRQYCHVYRASDDKTAEKINNALGEAFYLAYESKLELEREVAPEYSSGDCHVTLEMLDGRMDNSLLCDCFLKANQQPMTKDSFLNKNGCESSGSSKVQDAYDDPPRISTPLSAPTVRFRSQKNLAEIVPMRKCNNACSKSYPNTTTSCRHSQSFNTEYSDAKLRPYRLFEKCAAKSRVASVAFSIFNKQPNQNDNCGAHLHKVECCKPANPNRNGKVNFRTYDTDKAYDSQVSSSCEDSQTYLIRSKDNRPAKSNKENGNRKNRLSATFNSALLKRIFSHSTWRLNGTNGGSPFDAQPSMSNGFIKSDFVSNKKRRPLSAVFRSKDPINYSSKNNIASSIASPSFSQLQPSPSAEFRLRLQDNTNESLSKQQISSCFVRNLRSKSAVDVDNVLQRRIQRLNAAKTSTRLPFNSALTYLDSYNQHLSDYYLTPDEEHKLSGASWFVGDVPKDLTHQILLRDQPGSFVVRKSNSQSNSLVLSIRVSEKHKTSGLSHYLIVRSEKGFRLKGFSKDFPSVHALVTHHSIMAEQLPCRLIFTQRNKQDRQSSGENLSVQPLMSKLSRPARCSLPQNVY